MKIFYLGPEGTNSDLASRAIFDKSFSFIPTNSIEDIFEKVALSHSYYGVIPFENSYQGVINSSLNSLMIMILKSLRNIILLYLITFALQMKQLNISNKKIVSRTGFGQCNGWLRETLQMQRVL